jgi:vitamin B12 transporter
VRLSHRILALAILGAGPLAPARVAAQGPTRISGRVLDASSGEPVAGAEVRADELTTVTDAAGTFAFGSVPSARVDLRVRRIGYAPARLSVDPVPGLERRVTVALAPLAVQLDSITVTAEPGAVAIRTPELVRRGGDLSLALDGWQGVTVRRAGNGAASPQVRGGGPEEVLVLVDGFAVNDPLTGRADLRRIASREVAEVTLLPGAQTVRSGARAVAGVLLVETRHDVRPEGSGWGGSYGAMGLRLGGSLGEVTVSGTAERLAQDFPYDVPEVRGGGRGTRENAAGEQYAAGLTWSGPAASVVVRGTAGSRGLPGTTTNPTPSAHASDRSAMLGVRTKGALGASASLQWLEARASDPAPPTGGAYDSYTHGIGATVELTRRHDVRLPGWRGDAGLTAETRGDRYDGDGVRAGTSFTQVALRADARVTGGSSGAWTLAPALRLDGWTGSTARASGRLDVGWQRGRSTWSFGVGSAVTPPVLADLFFREGVGVRLNPGLRPERVRWELQGGLRHDFTGGATASLRLFAGRVADMIVWAPDARFIWSPRNFDVVRRGGELSGDWSAAAGLRLSGGVTYAAVTYDVPGGAQVQYRPRVTADAAAVWSPGPWTVDVRAHLVGRRFPNSAGTNPRDAFALLDAGLERRLGAGLALRGEVLDLTDSQAEFLAGYPSPGRRLAFTFTMVAP